MTAQAPPDMVRGQRGRPLLLHLAGLALAVLAVPGILFLSLAVFEAVGDPGAGSFRALGVSGLDSRQFLGIAPVIALLLFAQGALAYGILRDRPWSRPLGTWLGLGFGLVLAGAQGIAGAEAGPAVASLLGGLLWTVVAGGYLYGKESVRAYYATLP